MMDDDAYPTRLKCDVELNFSGPNIATVNKWAADALRKAADQLEKNAYEDGFHPATDKVGKQIGTVYVDYSMEIDL